MKSFIYLNLKQIFSFVLIQVLYVSLLFGNGNELPHNTEAPLIKHLSTLNTEWLKQQDIPIDLLKLPVKFNTDNERIQLHLQLVSSILKNRSHDHLSPQQFVNRKKQLQSLTEYWQTGTFPINTYHPHRQPYFIDNFGTACAVGHLLLTSGQEKLAHHISEVQNYAYIHELDDLKLTDWAVENGFTKDELAWIQPNYGGHVCYYTEELPGETMEYVATNEPVSQQDIKTMMTLPAQNMLIAGGNFLLSETATGTPSASVFGYNGVQYFSYGVAIQGTVYDIEYHNGQIYAAGDFVLDGTNFYNIAYWDGTDWVGIQTGSMNGIIHEMVSYDCQLYVGGDFTSVNGNIMANLAVWDGTNWITTPQNCLGQSAMQPLGVNGAVNTFEIYKGKLAIGGEFTSVQGSATAVEGLIFWENQTVEFLPANGNLTSVDNLESYESALMVGGDSLFAYRWNKWYYPMDSIRMNESNLEPLIVYPDYNSPYPAFGDYYIWVIPEIGRTEAIFYDLPTTLFDSNDLAHLVIVENNTAHAINGLRGFDLPDSDYKIIADGSISAIASLGYQTFYGGNFTNITVDKGYISPSEDCTEYHEAEKAFQMERFFSSWLPVELSEFTLKATGEKTALLQWRSETETSSLHYEIERKTDEDADFTRIGVVAAAGESLSQIDYVFEDDISSVKGEYVYYRLKMVDNDQSYEYSPVRALKLPSITEVSISPNPAKNTVELSLQMPSDGIVTVNIYNLQGQQLTTYELNGNAGSFREQIDISNLESGLYLVELVTPNDRKTEKLEIVK